MVSEGGQQSLGEYLIESVLSERGNTRVYLAQRRAVEQTGCPKTLPSTHTR